MLGDRGTWVLTACPRLLPGSGPAEIQTRDLLGRARTLYRYSTQAACRPRISTQNYNFRLSSFFLSFVVPSSIFSITLSLSYLLSSVFLVAFHRASVNPASCWWLWNIALPKKNNVRVATQFSYCWTHCHDPSTFKGLKITIVHFNPCHTKLQWTN